MKKAHPNAIPRKIDRTICTKDKCLKLRNKILALSFHNDEKYSFTVTNIHSQKKEIPLGRERREKKNQGSDEGSGKRREEVHCIVIEMAAPFRGGSQQGIDK